MAEFNWQRLIEVAPLIVGALKPGSPEAGAMMRGYLESQQRLQQQERQTDQDRQQQALRVLQMRQAQQGMQLAGEQARITRGQQYGTAVGEAVERVAPADQPEAWPDIGATQQQLEEIQKRLAEFYRIAPESRAIAPLPNLSARQRRAQKRAAVDAIKGFDQYWGTDEQGRGLAAQAEKTTGPKTGTFAGKMWSEIRAMAMEGADLGAVTRPPVLAGLGKSDADRLQILDKLIAEAQAAGDTQAVATYQREQTSLITNVEKLRRAERDRFAVVPVTNADGTTSVARVNLETGTGELIALAPGMRAGRPTEGERAAAGFYERGLATHDIATELEGQLTTMWPQLDLLLPNWLQSAAGQSYRQAQRDFTEARLREVSGAAIAASEYENDAKTFFVRVGDTPQTVTQKQAARQRVIRGLRVGAGNLARPASPAPAPLPPRAAPPPSPLVTPTPPPARPPEPTLESDEDRARRLFERLQQQRQ